jgi:hypothetical protein
MDSFSEFAIDDKLRNFLIIYTIILIIFDTYQHKCIEKVFLDHMFRKGSDVVDSMNAAYEYFIYFAFAVYIGILNFVEIKDSKNISVFNVSLFIIMLYLLYSSYNSRKKRLKIEYEEKLDSPDKIKLSILQTIKLIIFSPMYALETILSILPLISIGAMLIAGGLIRHILYELFSDTIIYSFS